MTQTKEKTIIVSKLSHRQNLRSGFISYCCELRVGRTCYAAVEQEGNGGDERVDWNNTDHYLLLHHYILNTQKDFWRKYELEALKYMVEEGWKDEIKEKIELQRKFLLWEKLALKKPKTWSEARKIQEKLGFFDDMVGAWTTVYIEQNYGHIYFKD